MGRHWVILAAPWSHVPLKIFLRLLHISLIRRGAAPRIVMVPGLPRPLTCHMTSLSQFLALRFPADLLISKESSSSDISTMPSRWVISVMLIYKEKGLA